MGWITAALVAVFTLFGSVPAHAMGAALVGSISIANPQHSFNFPSATYSNNVLYIAFTATSCKSGDNCGFGSSVAPKVTSVAGAGLTFTEIGPAGGFVWNGSARVIQAWRALVTSGAGTGTVTITMTGGGSTYSDSMGAAMIKFTGTKTSGTNGADAVVQWASNEDSGSIQVSMSAFASSSNRPVAFFAHRNSSSTATQESGYTELFDAGHSSTPTMRYEAEWHATVAETTPSVTFSQSDNSGGFALEIAAGTTAVTLADFAATPLDGAVALSWETASELDNLGFYLYRSLSRDGPWTALNAALIPGLGSSPEGRRYSWTDDGLTNGTTYYYRLEDIDRHGKATSHGPVSATPQAAAPPPGEGEGGGDKSGGGGGSSGGGSGSGSGGGSGGGSGSDAGIPPNWTSHGNPDKLSLRVLDRSEKYLTLELTTGGFYSVPRPDGSTKLLVPGFFDHSEPGSPTVPTRRLWIDALVGHGVKVASVRPFDLVAFSGLVVPLAEKPLAVATAEGTYEARSLAVSANEARRLRRLRLASASSLFPDSPAAVLQTAFQGEKKKAYLELAPLRVDEASGRVSLARRLLVRLEFSGRVGGEAGQGDEGRRPPASRDSLASDSKDSPFIRFVTHQRGVHSVTYEEIPGLSGPLPVAWLCLSRLGRAVPFHVEPRGRSFGPGSVLLFFGEGTERSYANDAVYELSLSPGGMRMPTSLASRQTPDPTPLTQLQLTSSFEKNFNYLPALLDAKDLWMWDYGIGPAQAIDYPFSLSSPQLSPQKARLTIDLQGGSDTPVDPDHHVRVFLNGSLVGETSFDGMLPHTLRLNVSSSLLLDGDNILQLENAGDTGSEFSFVYLDRFSIDYPRDTVPIDGVLEGIAPNTGRLHLDCPTGSVLLDLSTNRTRWLGQALASSLDWNAQQKHHYLAVFPSAILHPEIRSVPTPTLKSPHHQADWILIAPEVLLPAASPLVALRETQGLKTIAASLEEIVSEFGFGETSPQAIRDFLAFAFHNWDPPSPRYVLLLGDATYDPKGFLTGTGTSRPDLLPTPMVKSSFLWTASDPLYASVNGDDLLPDLAIGRITAATTEEAQDAVQKILDFEATGQTLDGKAVLVADNPDNAGDFEADLDQVASLLSDRPIEKIYLTQEGSAAAAKAAVIAAFDQGASLVSYAGHGSSGLWASEGIFRNADVASLSPQPAQPLLLTFTCSNGFFLSAYTNSLAERFVLAPDKGSIAAFSPSGLSLNDAAHTFHKALVQELTQRGRQRLGDLVLAAQEDYASTGAFPELLSIYHLFGDPGLTLR